MLRKFIKYTLFFVNNNFLLFLANKNLINTINFFEIYIFRKIIHRKSKKYIFLKQFFFQNIHLLEMEGVYNMEDI